MLFQNPTDAEIRDILKKTRTIAVVGLSPRPERDSHRIASFLIREGYTVFGVRPGVHQILGRPCYPRLQEVPEPVDLVDVFRRPSAVAQHAEEAIAIAARTLWLQLGVVDEKAALRAAQAGLAVVMNRCILVEHGRLLG